MPTSGNNPTLKSVQASLDEFKELFHAHVKEDHEVYKRTDDIQQTLQTVQVHVKNMDDRFQIYEEQYKQSSQGLQETINDIKQTTDFIKTFLQGSKKLGKWALAAAGSIVVIVIASFIIAFFHIHP